MFFDFSTFFDTKYSSSTFTDISLLRFCYVVLEWPKISQRCVRFIVIHNLDRSYLIRLSSTYSWTSRFFFNFFVPEYLSWRTWHSHHGVSLRLNDVSHMQLWLKLRSIPLHAINRGWHFYICDNQVLPSRTRVLYVWPSEFQMYTVFTVT